MAQHFVPELVGDTERLRVRIGDAIGNLDHRACELRVGAVELHELDLRDALRPRVRGQSDVVGRGGAEPMQQLARLAARKVDVKRPPDYSPSGSSVWIRRRRSSSLRPLRLRCATWIAP